MKTDNKPATTRLAEPDTALKSYLQTLLDEIVPLDSPPERQKPTVKTNTRGKPAPKPAPVVTAPQPTALAAPADTVLETTRVAADTETEQQAYQLPEWSAAEFQALDFRAGGRDFCLPLVCMKSIVPLEKALTRVPGLPPWHLGVMNLRGQNVGVIDLSMLMLGQSAQADEADKFVLLLDDGRWGLACNGLGQAGRVRPEDVRWRKRADQPRYLEGVIKQRLVPVLSSKDVLQAVKAGLAR